MTGLSLTLPLVSPNDWLALTGRLVCAILLGGAIGLDRQKKGKAAGLRTHMLVSLGSALFVMVPLLTASSSDALSRSIQGVATGVGFLGAGEIIQQSQEAGKTEIKGLTTAASIWVTAALGILAGCGLWQVSMIGMGLSLVVLAFAKRVEKHWW